jgi:hypothetical protein
MASLCVSSSVTFSLFASSSSSSHKKEKSIIKNPFFGFSCALSKPSIRTSLPLTKRSFQVRCQDLSLVPREQRWMFEESEASGPVKPSLSLSLSLVSVSLPFLFVLFCFRGILFFFPSRYTYVYAFKWLCLFSEKYGKIERNCNVGSFILSFVIWHPSKQKYSLFTLSLSV